MRLFAMSQSPAAAFGAMLLILGLEQQVAARLSNPDPFFDTVESYSISIPRREGVDTADIYYPLLPANSSDGSLPIALFLQGALVNKDDYSNFAEIVASHGFVVVVPNHFRTSVSSTATFTGFIPEQQQVNDVLTYMVAENFNASSPVAGLLDSDTLVLLGHSFGGAVGLSAIQNTCLPVFCTEPFTRPSALKGGAFYGTTFLSTLNPQPVPRINNANIPLALLAGSRDSIATLSEADVTYARIEDSPKALITILGANHYGITNEDNAIREPISPTLDQDIATETIARWSALFLRGTVLNDPEAFNYVFHPNQPLDENVSVISQVRTIPESNSRLSLLMFGVIFAIWLKWHAQKAFQGK